MQADTVPMQVTIAGLAPTQGASGALTLYGELDRASGLVMVFEAAPLRPGVAPERRPDHAILTNDPAIEPRDSLFTEDHLRAAVNDYFAARGRGLLKLEPDVQRFDPAAKIEPDGMDERGRKYRFSPDLNDGMVAVLAMCWFAQQQTGFAAQLGHIDEFDDLSIATVGIHAAAGNPKTRGYTMGGSLAIGADGWPV